MAACKSGRNLLSWVCVLLISSGSVGKNLYLARAAGSCVFLHQELELSFFLLETFSVFHCDNFKLRLKVTCRCADFNSSVTRSFFSTEEFA